MTIPPKTLSAIQAAGQALDTARAELAAATQDHAGLVMQAVADNPFGAENDHLFNRWKAIARMSQSVQDMEAQCKAVFHAAAELAMDGNGEGHPSPSRKTRPGLIGHAAIDLAPSDVLARKPRGRPPGKQAAKRAAPGRKAKTSSTRPLKGNAARVFEHLQTLLNSKSFTRTTQSQVAGTVGIPAGSIAAAMKQLADKGFISEGERGHYKLA